jgi:hypothetical protein
MCSNDELDKCPFYELCEECHPEPDMEKRRKGCNCENNYYCGIYWAFKDGYAGLDEWS